MKISFIQVVVGIFIFCILLTGCSVKEESTVEEAGKNKEMIESVDTDTGYIVDKIQVRAVDSKGTNYEFVYNNETFKVLYLNNTWKIYESYKITNSIDIKKICKALIDIHPIHGSDMVSYRTEMDMAYEWMQHNLAYQILPEGNAFKSSARDVDLDPKDQGKSLVEMYEDRTGQKLDLGKVLK